jgi:CBS domain-containing protein
MFVRQLLTRTKLQLVTCGPDDTIQKAATSLSDERIGALPVMEYATMVGIISERDVCRGVALHGKAAAALRVRDLMTPDVAVCRLDDSAKDAMRTMLHRHIRHLPVMEDGDLVGMISLRDVLAAAVDEARLEAEVLRDLARSKA